MQYISLNEQLQESMNKANGNVKYIYPVGEEGSGKHLEQFHLKMFYEMNA